VAEEAERPARRGAAAKTERPMRAAAYLRAPVVRIGSAIALLLAIGVFVWLVVRDGEGESSSLRRAPASAASIRVLNEFASSIGHPVYWAGSQPRFTYELSRTKDGRIYVRYLPPGVKLGNAKPYLTVGTYPQRKAFATLRATAKKQQARTIRLAGGGLAFQDKNRPTSVYLAYPRSDYQIEVFDPSPARARSLVASGQIKAVGAPPRTPAGSRAASVQELKSLAVRLGHPIYWAGEGPDMSYELTRTRDGSVYLRYLPPGVGVGDRRPNYLTIGTYPQKGAFEILKATAAKNRVKTLRVENGGLAFVDRKHPTSAYVAYPAVDFQIEVYDPAPGQARQLVTSGQIAPIR
jgi:hypothetical protein